METSYEVILRKMVWVFGLGCTQKTVYILFVSLNKMVCHKGYIHVSAYKNLLKHFMLLLKKGNWSKHNRICVD